MGEDTMPAEARALMIEQMRRLYRGLEMSAGIMRDRRRTGGWEGADRTADAFARYAATAQSIHALLVAATPSTDARARGQAEEREAGWTYEYDSGAGWETHVVLNTAPNLPTKRAPTKHYGSPDIRNVRSFYYAAIRSGETPLPGAKGWQPIEMAQDREGRA